ncbi:hypothetical protein JTE90_009432 [Oedothorax gibbosus]|uniref:Meteorin-like protein n=1 Tax=Oedothorax gibbosus TaxID=931172 RepID=A0AAV6VU02_9ARAC|nr:hypothetical protein JTE90_009432 [Oedothorax gibbosus]
MRLIICWLLGFLLINSVIASGPSMDNCDWVGSGTLAMALSKSIQPVYLRCNQGTVQWRYPQGALRIVLQHRTPGTPFSACIRRSSTSSGARIHLAGKTRLHRVFSKEDPADLVRCVGSVDGKVALYVEADSIGSVLRKEMMDFSYYLKRRTRRSVKEFTDDCQPCSESELLRQYCSSDFVIQGSVASLFNNKQLQTTELTVRVSRVHRTNSVQTFTQLSDPDIPLSGSTGYVILHRPLRCGTKSGSGEYLFLGNWILGNPSLNCVPRMAEWKKVRRKAMKEGTNECILSL